MSARVTARTGLILRRLAHHVLNDLRCAAVTPSQMSWEAFKLTGPYRFGWAPPMAFDDEGVQLLVVPFCPELIARTTLWLDDETLDTYLTVIESFVDAMVAAPNRERREVYAEVENRLYEVAPATLELMSQVEARALDEGVVPKATPTN